VGAALEVPVITGGTLPYANLDVAASAPSLVSVQRAVDEFLPWYSSVHRGAGYKSMVSTWAYEDARSTVGAFINARPDDVVLFTRNTTDALNLLAHALPADCHVVLFETEHHANLLPWRRRRVTFLPPPRSPGGAADTLRDALRSASGEPCLVAVTGASNVTGELWPVAELTRIAHDHGARVVLDAAQLAPHRRLDVIALDVDYVALSGHKLYAPFGVGVLAGRRDWLEVGEPFLVGGGAVEFVTTDEVVWSDVPDRQEAGSPNVVGAVAVAAACLSLEAVGMERVQDHEEDLLTRAEAGLGHIRGVERYTLWDSAHPRIGVVTFNVAGYHHALLAAILSAEYAIGVRHGCFCAHPLMLHLLRVGAEQADAVRAGLRQGERHSIPGAVRASFGASTSVGDVDRLVEAIGRISTDGPRWTYERVPNTDDFIPVPDWRAPPRFSALRRSCRPAGIDTVGAGGAG
jgi:selenocysteine lyase/cysteine desulfurase